MSIDLNRKLPFSAEAEQSLLGAIIIRPTAFEDIAGAVTANDFYMEEHKAIFNAMSSMFNASKNIDTVTLVNTLIQTGKYDKSGGVEYIKNLSIAVPTAANIRDYAKIVRDNALLRRLIGACDEINDMAYTAEGSAEQIVDGAEQKIFEIAQNRISNEFRHIHDVITDVYQGLQVLSENPNRIDGVRTGFSGLDRVLVQLGKGDLVLIGARPGMGKTSFALNIATNVAKATKKAVCIFSLEMSAEQLVTRILSSEAMVNSYSLRSGQISPDDWTRLSDATTDLSGCDIYIDDTSGVTPTEMKAKLRRVQNLGLVVIDYLQLMTTGKNVDSRVQEVGEISRTLKLMAKELGVPVVCCAQLSRGPEKNRTSKRPMLSDLRDSGSIEQDADVVIFLYREEYYKNVAEDTGEEVENNIAEVIVQKNRHGSSETVKMTWDGQFTKFGSIENHLQEP